MSRFDDLTGIRFLRILNDAGAAIPAFAALRLSGRDADSGAFKVAKVNADSMTTGIVFASDLEIPAVEGFGDATNEFPLIALCNPADPAPVAGESWGTANGVWHLVKGKTGFQIVGNLLTTAAGHYAQVVPVVGGDAAGQAKFIRFTLPGALAVTAASIAACTVDDFWGGTDPGAAVTVYNLPASVNYIFSGAAGNKGVATYDEIDNKYWILQLECP